METLKQKQDEKISHLSQLTYHQAKFQEKLNEARWRLNKATIDLGGNFKERESEDLKGIEISNDKDHILSLRELLILMDRDLKDIYCIVERLELLTNK